jgi:hypothetical protein
MTTKISKSLLESISNVVNSDSTNLTESVKDNLLQFVSDFDADENTNVGYWMKSFNAMEKLMKKAKNNNYNFKEVMLPKGKQGTKETVIADHKTKGYMLFDYGTTSKGETGLLFYKDGNMQESEEMSEAKDSVYDYQGKDPYEFVDGFDDAEGTKVGSWMRRPEAMRKLMKAANTNSYEFKEVILPKGEENTEAEVEKQMKNKGYKLFDTGMNFGSGNLLTGPKGNYFTGLLFYKKK